MTLMKKMAKGANRTICRIELMATRIAQYCSSSERVVTRNEQML